MKMQRLNICLAGLTLLLTLTAPTRAAEDFTSAYISEILAVNQRGLQDEDGTRSGWVEIYNGRNKTLYLGGWFLTDTPTNLTKWRFPRVGLLAEKSLIVFASGKDRTNELTHLHANFRLNQEGGYLALVNADTNIVSEFTYPAQSADVSYGSVRGEPAIRGFFTKPTPAKHNMSKGKGFAPEVFFSQPSGTFTSPFKLVLSNATPGATIRFTLDGTIPSSNSTAYTGPLTIGNSLQVRARVYKPGLLPGPPKSESYVFLHTNVLNFTSSLPVIVLDSFGRNQATSAKSSFVHLSVYEPGKGATSLTNRPTLATRAGFHRRGSTTVAMPQASYAVEFLDEFNQDENLEILGMPAESDWVLYAPNSFDAIMIHNPFIHQLSRDMGHWSPRTRFVEVFLANSSGPISSMQYNGIYVLEEKIKIGKDRLDIDRLGPDDVKGSEISGGYLFKRDRLGVGEMGFWAANITMAYVDPKEQAMLLPQRTPQRQYLNRYLNDFQNVLNSPKWKDPLTGYRAYVDVDSWIDYHVLEVLSGNVDSLYLSTFIYKPRDGKLTYGPHWDFDRALGSTDQRNAYPRKWNTGPFFTGNAWWSKLLSDPDFWQLWVDRWQDARTNPFSLTNLFRLIDQFSGELREAQPREAQRWGLNPRGGSYQAEIDHMKDWVSNRVEFIDRQLTQPPAVKFEDSPAGPRSMVTLSTSTNTTIYYTLNGTDPRLSQGAIHPYALVYSEPIPLKSNERLFARGHNPAKIQSGGPLTTTPWSSPVKAQLDKR